MALEYTDHRKDPAAWARSLGISNEAVQLYLDSEVIDLHIDSFLWTRMLGYDLTRRHTPGLLNGAFARQVDLPRLREAQVSGATWIITTNPARSSEDRAHTFVRTHARRDFLRASVEQMAGVRANTPSGELPPDAGTLREHFAHPDASALPRPTRSIWTRRNGVETTTVDRYLGPTSVALLEDDLAVFATPQRLPTLLAVLGGQTAVASALPRTDNAGRGPRLVALLTARGVRNLLSAPGRNNPIPVSAELAIQATRDASGDDDGGAILRSTWRYDSPEQATATVRLMEVFALDLRESIEQFAGTLGGPERVPQH